MNEIEQNAEKVKKCRLSMMGQGGDDDVVRLRQECSRFVPVRISLSCCINARQQQFDHERGLYWSSKLNVAIRIGKFQYWNTGGGKKPGKRWTSHGVYIQQLIQL